MAYDNRAYWQELHKQFSGKLRAVGFPWLSETFNELKYKSEASSLVPILSEIATAFTGSKSLSVLDAGAGTGYWTRFVAGYFKDHSFSVQSTALDISEDALKGIQALFPECSVARADLKSVDISNVDSKYNIVFSFYCLHHLVHIEHFLNGLHFVARSVKPGGYLLIMDPILTRPFSTFHAIDFVSWKGNGIPRPRHIIDDVLQEEGFERVSFSPAVSFVLNGNIEAPGSISFLFHRMVWTSLGFLYRSPALTKLFSENLFLIDRLLKRTNRAFSSSLLVSKRKSTS